MTLSTPQAVQARLDDIERDLAIRQNAIRTEDRGYPTPCWVWRKSRTTGYGDGWFNGEHMLAHRWTYREVYGWVPTYPHQLDHLCRNRACCNPLHLEAVWPTTNARRSGKSKLTEAQVSEILLAVGESYRALAARYGVTHQTIAYYRSGAYANRKSKWPGGAAA